MKNKMRYIDVHSHIHDIAFDSDRDTVLTRMEEAGVATIAIGTGLETSKRAMLCAEQHANVYATVGLHPVDDVLEEFDATAYEVLAQHEKVVCIGECGLDYHYIETFFEKEKKEKGLTWNKDAEVDRQQCLFIDHIELSVKVGKPLMLHGRPSPKTMDAYEDMCYILGNAQKKHGDLVRGNFHFFSGDIKIAQQVLDLGFTVSFSGVITFTSQYDDVVKYVPLDQMHAETDSPYATPKPFRGERNEPTHVREVYKKIAELRGEDENSVRSKLLENAQKSFAIKSL